MNREVFADIPSGSNEDIYRYDLSNLQIHTDRRTRDELAAMARVDPVMRDRFVASLLPVIYRYALQLQRDSVDAMELVCVGNAIVIELMREALLYRDNPCAFLLMRAKFGMRLYLRCYGHGPITYPDNGDVVWHHHFLRLDNTDTDLFDILDVSEGYQADDESFDPRPLYDALNALSSEDARELVCQAFGLFGQETRTLIEIAGGNSRSKAYKAKGEALRSRLRTMRAYLLEHYPDFVERYGSANPYEQQRAKAFARLYELGTIQPAARKRLDKAKARIEERGEAVTFRRLEQEAHIDTLTISAYLYEMRLFQEQAWEAMATAKKQAAAKQAQRKREEQQRRLATALQQLLQQGTPITLQELQTRARANTHDALRFLHEWRAQQPHLVEANRWKETTPGQRITAAIRELQAEGQPLTQRLIAARAHVGSVRVGQYLRQQREIQCQDGQRRESDVE